jgi:hypothetical protein
MLKKQKSRNVDSVLAMAKHWINQGHKVIINPYDNFGYYSIDIATDITPSSKKPAYEIGD